MTLMSFCRPLKCLLLLWAALAFIIFFRAVDCLFNELHEVPIVFRVCVAAEGPDLLTVSFLKSMRPEVLPGALVPLSLSTMSAPFLLPILSHSAASSICYCTESEGQYPHRRFYALLPCAVPVDGTSGLSAGALILIERFSFSRSALILSTSSFTSLAAVSLESSSVAFLSASTALL